MYNYKSKKTVFSETEQKAFIQTLADMTRGKSGDGNLLYYDKAGEEDTEYSFSLYDFTADMAAFLKDEFEAEVDFVGTGRIRLVFFNGQEFYLTINKLPGREMLQ